MSADLTAADAARLLAALDAPNGRMHARLALRKAAPDLARAVIRLEAERDAYKRAKAENDDRFMLERDVARAEVEQLRAIVAAESGEAGPPGWEWFDGYWRRDLDDNRQLRASRAEAGEWWAVIEGTKGWDVRVLTETFRWALDAMVAADAEARR